jgi:phytol kinase
MISTFVQNTILSLIVTSITFAVVSLLSYFNRKNSITTEVSRKVVHIGAGTLYLAIYFYNDQGYFSKYFNIFPNLLWTGILIWKSQHRSSVLQKYDLVVGTMTRNHRESELLRGPLFFNFVMIICGTVLYKTILGSIIMGILTWGDGLAAVIGVNYGSQRKIYRSKTFDGLLTIFIVGIIASMIYISLLVDFQSIHVFKICVISFITAVIETLSPSDFDNLTIPLSITVVYYFIY